MTQKNIINELIGIEAFADQLKLKASKLRKVLGGVYPSAPTGVKLQADQKTKLMGNRKKTIVKNQS